MKKSILILTAVLGLFLFAGCSSQEFHIADKPKASAVYDQAHVLSSKTIHKIDNMNTESDKTDKKLKIGVYITDSLNGEDLEETTLKIARKWKIGDKDTNNGALLFISIDDKETRIETSDNLATRLTDAQSKQILENMKPDLRKKDYDKAVLTAIKSISDVNDGKKVKSSNDDEIWMYIALAIAVILIVLAGAVVSDDFDGFSGGFGSSGSSDGGFSGGGFSGGGASGGW